MGSPARVRTLATAALAWDDQGHALSARYGDVYASRAGAIGQARHVFLAGNGLPDRWAARRSFTIVETGFGLGTNFLATWQAWRDDPQRCGTLHFVSLERHPIAAADMTALMEQEADPAVRALRHALARHWPLPLAGLHRLSFDEGRVLLTLAFGDARELAGRLCLGADAFYLDGFAPGRNPELWETALMRDLARLARPEATVATWSVARGVRDALAQADFVTEQRPGFGGKRDMLAGHHAPRGTRRHPPPAVYAGPRSVAVVGAGLAGCAAALALARRGWHVKLLDAGAGVAGEASSLPAGVLQPLLSRDDNLTSRWVRAGYLHALGEIAASPGVAIAAGGVLLQAATAGEEQELQARLARDAWPEPYVRGLDAQGASARLGVAPARGGAWFEGGTVVSPARWCEAMVAQARTAAAAQGAGLELLAGHAVRAVSALPAIEGPRWRLEREGADSVEVAVVILANSAGLAQLTDASAFGLQRLAGRVSLVRAPALAALRGALSGDGTVVPLEGDTAAVGATYEDADDPQEALTEAAAHAANIARLQRLLAQPPEVERVGLFTGLRCMTRDRLPLAGPLVETGAITGREERLRGAPLRDLPRQGGLYVLAALGSRGLALCTLLGELVASQITGEPLPVERELADAVDPGRFSLRALR